MEQPSARIFLIAEAKEVIDQFYAERAEAVAGTHDRNVGAQDEFCKQRDSLFSTGEVCWYVCWKSTPPAAKACVWQQGPR